MPNSGTLMIMFYQTTFFVVFLIGLVIADRKSANYVAIKSPDGEELCAVDVPTAVEWLPAHGSEVLCGLECIRRNHCEAFNFNSELGKCDQYETTPSVFSVIPGCKGYNFGRKWEVSHRVTSVFETSHNHKVENCQTVITTPMYVNMCMKNIDLHQNHMCDGIVQRSESIKCNRWPCRRLTQRLLNLAARVQIPVVSSGWS